MPNDASKNALRKVAEVAADCKRRGVRPPPEVEGLLLLVRVVSSTVRSTFPSELLVEMKREGCIPKELEELVFWAERIVPDWVCNVYRQVHKMFPMPKLEIAKSENPDEHLNAIVEFMNRNNGSFQGRLVALDCRSDPEAEVKDKELLESLKSCVASIWDKPFRYAAAWFDGFANGLNERLVDERGRPLRYTSALPVYMVLLQHWHEVSTFRSVTELRRWLSERVPALRAKTAEQELKHLQTVQKLCQRIGLHFRPRGRPRLKK